MMIKINVRNSKSYYGEIQSDLKDEMEYIDQLSEQKNQNYQTLVRIAIEFCIELKDCLFLFDDLFQMF